MNQSQTHGWEMVAEKISEMEVALAALKATFADMDGPVPQEFKAECWGEGTCAKRTIMDSLYSKNKYLIGFGGDNSEKADRKRTREMDKVQVSDVLHMKSKNNKDHYEGVVSSHFTSITLDELLTDYSDIVQAAWSLEDRTRQLEANNSRFMTCDVIWTKKPLTEDMKYRLNNVTKNGGGLQYTRGSLKPLS
jgi:hypothetical protein